MKISTRHLFVSAAIAFFLTLTLATFAEDTKPDTAPAPSSSTTPAPAPEPTPAVAPAEQTATPATTPADGTVTPAVAPAAAPKAEVESSEPPKLRRLDTDENVEAPKTHKEKIHERIERAKQRAAERRANSVGRDIVNIFSDSNLPKGEKADSVVAIFGSATAEGDATDAVVSVFGSSHTEGSVSDAVVSVLGDTEANGDVGDVALAVAGNTTVNGHVHGDVVAVLGDIKLGPNAEVDGQVVCVGGTVTRDPKAILHHSVQHVGLGHMHGEAGLKAWFRECLVFGRPLAFGANLMWAWWIALGFLVFYVLLALLFGKGVNKCVDTFEQRPGYSILTALLTVVLAPIAIIILAITGIGIAVIPFLSLALFLASLFGKAVMFAWIGRRIGRSLGMDHPALAVLIGGVIVLFLYTVPFFGLILYKLLGWIGLGVVVYTLLGLMKREKPAIPPAGPTPLTVPVAPIAPIVAPAATSGDAAMAAAPVAAVPVVPVLSAVPPIISAVTLNRAGFWIRLAAAGLDAILIAIALHLIPWAVRPSFPLAYAGYCLILWALKATTVGGIVCGLKIVRVDDRPMDWATALVRTLGGFLSLFVVGLGFLWVVFDDQRQSWHDKIAGTTIVHVPKGVSLV